jgi:hypothetical protein
VYNLRDSINFEHIINTNQPPVHLCVQGSTQNLIVDMSTVGREFHNVKMIVYNSGDQMYEIRDPNYYEDIRTLSGYVHTNNTRTSCSDRRGNIYRLTNRMTVYDEKGRRTSICMHDRMLSSECCQCLSQNICADQNVFGYNDNGVIYEHHDGVYVNKIVQYLDIRNICTKGIKLAVRTKDYAYIYDLRMYRFYKRVPLPNANNAHIFIHLTDM